MDFVLETWQGLNSGERQVTPRTSFGARPDATSHPHRFDRDREAVGVLDDQGNGERLPGFEPVRGVEDQLRLPPEIEAERERPEPVVGLGVGGGEWEKAAAPAAKVVYV